MLVERQSSAKATADELKGEWKELTATASKGFKDLGNKISAAAKSKDKKKEKEGGTSSGKEK